jgi:hypothetical protein
MSLSVFFMELSNELRNAVKLFEEGVFGTVFYSGGSAVEQMRGEASCEGELSGDAGSISLGVP